MINIIDNTTEKEFNDFLKSDEFKIALNTEVKKIKTDMEKLKNNFNDPDKAAEFYFNELNENLIKKGIQKNSEAYSNLLNDLVGGFFILNIAIDRGILNIGNEKDLMYLKKYTETLVSLFQS